MLLMSKKNPPIILSYNTQVAILQALGIEVDFNNKIRDACPVHMGDNPTSFSGTLGEDSFIWSCWSNDCHKRYGNDIIGLIAGIKQWSRKEAYKWVVTNFECETISSEKAYIHKTNQYYDNKSADKFISRISIPRKPIVGGYSNYFAKMGLSDQTLEHFEIKYCNNKVQPMHERHFAPIFDPQGEFIIGFTGRSKWEECQMCEQYHNPKEMCPTDLDESKVSPKWKHYGINTQKYFYNVDKAAKHIEKTGCAIIFEGPKPVWKFYQFGKENTLSTLGSFLTEEHLNWLLRFRTKKIIMAYDKDETGIKRYHQIVDNYSKYMEIYDLYKFLEFGQDPFDISNDTMLDVINYCEEHENL